MREGKERPQAEAKLVYQPADPTMPSQESNIFYFEAPLGPIESEELSWYLERYIIWPVGFYQEKAKGIEAKLPNWGQQLYQEATKSESARAVLRSWEEDASQRERRFSVLVDPSVIEGSPEEEAQKAQAYGNLLLTLPWELLHDGKGFLFQGKRGVRVRRRLPNHERLAPGLARLPIRVLLVSPRPEAKGVAYIDHRASALPLAQAIAQLGSLVQLDILAEPTKPALERFLQQAEAEGDPVEVLHFDGHGVYSPEKGLGMLVFEHPEDQDKLGQRRAELIDAEALGRLLRDYRIPVVFLEACQTAQAVEEISASVAARLLQVGVTSVVAMSHSVLVETAKRFTEAFYGALAQGQRVGEAMLAGQQVLHHSSYRGKLLGSGEFHLQDWFVPVLYQEEQDPQLFPTLNSEEVQQRSQEEAKLRRGALPPIPHGFVGRSRELLRLERILRQQSYAVIQGQGGAGKTALGSELAQWYLQSQRVQRVAFLSLETHHELRMILQILGEQLLPQYSVAEYGADLKKATQPLLRALGEQPTLLLLDNLESVLPGPEGQVLADAAAPIDELLSLFQGLMQAAPHTRLLFTTREALPAPFDRGANSLRLGQLGKTEAIELLSQVMSEQGWSPPLDDQGREKDLEHLAEQAHYHARALVLLAREIGTQGVTATSANFQQLMSELERKQPGDRENSLYASLALSLGRLTEEERKLVEGLACFEGGCHLDIWRMTSGISEKERERIVQVFHRLIEVGLASLGPYNYLHLDPALPSYLRGQLSPETLATYQRHWLGAMRSFAGYLYQQQSKDAQVQASLTLLDLPNLLGLLAAASSQLGPEEMIGLTNQVESLLQNLPRPQALQRVIAYRKAASAQLSAGWSHARFLAMSKEADRLLDQGRIQAAYELAERIRQQALAAGEAAFPAAPYDLAMAHLRVGRMLRMGGAAQTALPMLQAALQRFEALAESGARMAAACLLEMGDCLVALGQYEQAAEVYEAGIRRSEQLEDVRQVAVGKGQLATVRLSQQDYAAALAGYQEAQQSFEALGEAGGQASAWHQIARVYQAQEQWSQAEPASRRSMAIEVKRSKRSGEASTLNQLGNLYAAQGKTEQSAAFFQQAAEIYISLGDEAQEGRAQNNLANRLIQLKRYAEARKALERAIICDEGLGHAAEPWKTYDILYQLETAQGNPEAAAAAAKAQAAALYLANRRDGGEPRFGGGRLCKKAWQAIQAGNPSPSLQEIDQMLAQQDLHESWFPLLPNLKSILEGRREEALFQDPALSYADSAELQLLLERIAAHQ
ncbi:MAG: tetratricopeptide repeat protein [Bacteroidota bacterium]